MRLQSNKQGVNNEDLCQFLEWILIIGEGVNDINNNDEG